MTPWPTAPDVVDLVSQYVCGAKRRVEVYEILLTVI